MSKFCGVHRPPRAGIDPVETATAALSVISLALQHPAQPETVVLVLDGDRRGRTVVVVDGTAAADDVLEVVEQLAGSLAEAGHHGALVVATVRPAGGLLPDDGDRWLEASDLAEGLGVELLEWFVITDAAGAATAWCPRDLLGEPPRWRP